MVEDERHPSPEDWLARLLGRFDPGWLPITGGLAVDEAERGGLQRISADHAAERLSWMISFYVEERPALVRFARSLLGRNADAAEDLLQEVMRKMCQKPPELREPAKRAAFFHQAIRNEAITQGTRATKEAARRSDEAEPVDPTDHAAAFEDPVIAQMVLARALTRLSPRERAVIELVDIRRMTVQEAADELEIALGTAKNFRFVALRRLRGDPGVADLHAAA